MAENFPSDKESQKEKREKLKEAEFNKANRIKENLMKLEKSVVDVIDETTQAARGAIQAMGFGVQPVDDDNSEDDNTPKTSKKL